MSPHDRFFPSALNARLSEVGFGPVQPPGTSGDGANYWQLMRATGEIITVSVYKMEPRPTDQKMVLSVSVTRGEAGKRLACITTDERYDSRSTLLNALLDRVKELETRLLRALDVALEEAS